MYKYGIVQYILSIQVIVCYKNWILHRQTVYGITEEMMLLKNKFFKILIKTYRTNY
jgi:hypothetical protein